MSQSNQIKWPSLIVGIIFLMIAVFIISFPQENLFVITWLIGLLFIVNGFMELVVSYNIRKHTNQNTIFIMLTGVINIIIGFVIMLNIVTSTTFIIYLFAIWFIIHAIFAIFTVTQLERSNHLLHIISILINIIEIIFGILLLFNPLIAAVLVSFVLAFVFVIIGIAQIITALS
ncbi:HdeD family acid-resistance protein [Staphylococcus gallinarum]|uniref:HdeD family acid-resistance protein n=1 Tax=Staphylococcus gallinarum TaxID=1293 RepID=A0A3A0VYK6_STAGA|nr:DUF308 domain-containing protein [Staphylococcus gallinarum]RIP32743.1 HdeD family acid-resistance protein [Staphylococcus gallinarum]